MPKMARQVMAVVLAINEWRCNEGTRSTADEALIDIIRVKFGFLLKGGEFFVAKGIFNNCESRRRAPAKNPRIKATSTVPHCVLIHTCAMHKPHTFRRKTKSTMPSREAITALSLILNVLLAISLFLLGFQLNKEASCIQGKEMTFHGGHPESTKTGTCWCGHEDRYCMCTPSLAIDLVIQESG